MRLAPVIAIFLFTACTNSIGQQQSEEQKDEQAFKALIQKSQQTNAQSQIVQQSADKKTQTIITKAAATIVTLKEENQQLKQELNEATNLADSIIDISNSVNFRLRAISRSEEDR